MEEVNASGDPLSLFYPDPGVRKEAMETVGGEPSGLFREWHPVTRYGTELVTLWANFELPDGMECSQETGPILGASFHF